VNGVITREEIPEIFRSVSIMFARKKDELCEMDARMGDGDLGLTMNRGFAALPDLLMGDSGEDIGRMLMKAGMKMSSIVPSTMGTLMASGLMEGGKQLRGLDEINAEKLVDFIAGYAEGIRKRGKVNAGERTIYDALLSAANAARDKVKSGNIVDVIGAACDGAEAGVRATENMIPRHGKAAVFTERAQGVPDQGAVAGMYFLYGLRDGIIKCEGKGK
jgi:dihydroxyacetone kinase-like protein